MNKSPEGQMEVGHCWKPADNFVAFAVVMLLLVPVVRVEQMIVVVVDPSAGMLELVQPHSLYWNYSLVAERVEVLIAH